MKMISVFLILILIIGTTFFIVKKINADWTYTVRRGDTLFSIAQRMGVSENDIKQRNGYWSNALKIGQSLIIPTAVAKAAPVGGTSGNVELLSRLIHAEAGVEPYVGKVAVGGVIMNRIQNPKFPKTIAGVIYQPHAFESVSNGTINLPAGRESIKAAMDALSGWDPSGGALYFFNPAKTSNSWIWARRIINQIGHHIFAL